MARSDTRTRFRLARTEGLTPEQTAILEAVHTFVDQEILPVATALEHADEYPQDIVDGLREMGMFGLTIPEEYGGLGESLLTYTLAVEELSRGWMSVSGILNTHFIIAYMLMQHGTEEQKRTYLPRLATVSCVRRSRCPSRAAAPTSPASRPRPYACPATRARTRSAARRCG